MRPAIVIGTALLLVGAGLLARCRWEATMQKWNKASIAAIAGAIATAVSVTLGLTAEVQGAIATVMTTVLVWLVPNRDAAAK